MDRRKWATPEKMRSLVFAYSIAGKFLQVYASESEAAAAVVGLEIVEGDWKFFSSNGSPLEADFSIQPRIHPERNTYTKGVYTLKPANAGTNLYTLLSIVECHDDTKSGLSTLRDIEQFLEDQILENQQSKVPE